MLSPGSSALNRFVVSQLFHRGAFHPLLKHGKTRAVLPQDDGRFEVTFLTGSAEVFDSVVQRHGPVSVLQQDFLDLASACGPLQDSWNSFESDWTSDGLLEDEASSSASVEKIVPPLDPLHAVDMDAAVKSGYKISSVASRETVLVVIGTGFWQELLDRPAAHTIEDAIRVAGNTPSGARSYSQTMLRT